MLEPAAGRAAAFVGVDLELVDLRRSRNDEIGEDAGMPAAPLDPGSEEATNGERVHTVEADVVEEHERRADRDLVASRL